MRIVVLIFAILGAVATAGVGYIGWSTLYEPNGLMERAKKLVRNPEISAADKAALRTEAVRRAALVYSMMAGGVLGLAGAVLAVRGRGVSGGVLLLLAVSGPWVLAASFRLLTKTSADVEAARNLVLITLMPTSFLAVAGLLALRLRPRRGPVFEEVRREPGGARDWEEDEAGEALPRPRRTGRHVPPER
jgi:hypothetical protein